LGRRFGQHFLARQSILDRIAAAACPENTPSVIEIGPGRGALTEALLQHAGKVVAIEVDPVLVHYLQPKFHEQMETGRLELIAADVLKIDLAALAAPSRAVLAGNLPYYITSPILERVFALGDAWERVVFMVQAEVAARLAAGPGRRDYGYLSVLAQIHASVQILCEVPRAAFRPPPKVDSAVVLLEPRDSDAEWGIADRAAFLRFASDCFRHKRKTLRNNLTSRYGREKMDAAGLGKQRAEQMTIAELAELHRRLSAA
jgi:16S rRNA (adenine1518-N6/adenine1519-N6)-dimethyltransferase